LRAGIKHLGTRAPGAKGPSTYRRQRDVELFRFIGPAGRPISETGRCPRRYLNIGDDAYPRKLKTTAAYRVYGGCARVIRVPSRN